MTPPGRQSRRGGEGDRGDAGAKAARKREEAAAAAPEKKNPERVVAERLAARLVEVERERRALQAKLDRREPAATSCPTGYATRCVAPRPSFSLVATDADVREAREALRRGGERGAGWDEDHHPRLGALEARVIGRVLLKPRRGARKGEGGLARRVREAIEAEGGGDDAVGVARAAFRAIATWASLAGV